MAIFLRHSQKANISRQPHWVQRAVSWRWIGDMLIQTFVRVLGFSAPVVTGRTEEKADDTRIEAKARATSNTAKCSHIRFVKATRSFWLTDGTRGGLTDDAACRTLGACLRVGGRTKATTDGHRITATAANNMGLIVIGRNILNSGQQQSLGRTGCSRRLLN